MRKSQVNRAVVAARAAQNVPARPVLRVSTGTSRSVSRNPALRPITPIAHCEGSVRRTRAVPMTGAQRNSAGKRSEWNASMYYFTDPAWSQTVSNQRGK